MKKHLIFVFGLLAVGAYAQNPTRASLDSKATELWELTPKKITPGSVMGEAPSDAIVLFNGKDLSSWNSQQDTEAKWEVKDGAMTVVKGTGEIRTKQKFGDIQLHIEWRTPAIVIGDGQGRSNSGIFLQGRYELQVLDSYDNPTYTNGQAGSIYKQSIPLANVCRKPGEWQTYDVIYTAPRFSENGRVITPAAITVLQNGVLVQNNFQIWGPTQNQGSPLYESHGKASLSLQDHGNPISFRNIWVREL